MAKVIICSTAFPAYHADAAQKTHFVEKIWTGFNLGVNQYHLEYSQRVTWLAALKMQIDDNILGNVSPKIHTIRKGKRWKVGDLCSLRIWSGKPYRSKQIIIAPELPIRSVLNFDLLGGKCFINGKEFTNFEELAKNDGLTESEFFSWFKDFSFQFEGQIISWTDISY